MTPDRICVLDLETRSTINLGRGGTNAYVYAAHPTTDVWMTCYAWDDDPDTVRTWWPGDPMPADLRQHVVAGGVVSAHNAGFEHAVWNAILTPRYGWSPLPLEQLDDTAARAARCGLPRKLELAAPALGLEQIKDMKGAAQMKRMAKPRKVEEDGTITWWDVPERVERLHTYCEQDVRTQLGLHLALPRLPPAEWEVWQATMRANVRGCLVDTDFVAAAREIIDRKLAEYARELLLLTNGQVKSHTDLNGMKAWLASRGHPVDSLDKNVVASLVADHTLPDEVRRVVGVRAEAGKSSVAKYPAMAAHVDAHGIARDQLVYYGAQATGRWSGQGIQLQNLPARGGVGFEEAEWHVANTLRHGAREGQEMMELLQDGSAIETLSMCLRGAIRARPGMDIVCADYSNIEGRKAAWLAGEEWKLEAFRAFDAGHGPDLYKVAAGGILGIPAEEVEKSLRNSLGKVSELALQFGGGVGAFLSMAAVYRVEIADYWGVIQDALPKAILSDTEEAWDSFGARSGTDKTTWLAAEAVKRAWRAKHPEIVQAWRDCEDGAVGALVSPGTIFSACQGRIKFVGKSLGGKPVLLMRLPSGRCIYYFNARVRDRSTPWGSVTQQVVFDKVEGGRPLRSGTYGGDIFQTCLGRDTLVMTGRGWVPITQVSAQDSVWDGEEWVSCDGVVFSGRRPTIRLAGVEMTADHKVLTEDGWKNASSCPGYHRAESRLPDSRGDGPVEEHDPLPPQERGPSRTPFGPTEPGEQLSEVFDILNCGPRHRFVVQDAQGRPMIVHNCVQGSARDIMAHGWLSTEKGGYLPLFSVHDELASEFPEGQADIHDYCARLCDLPPWAQGLPVTADGYISKRFRKD